MPSSRVTQKELARRIGITQSAISLALANHPSISISIRRKVRELADELGYVPDPYLSGLSAYRRTVRPAQFQGTLAWVTNHPDEQGWSRSLVFRGYHEGAVAKAAELGYKIETHWLRASGMTSTALEKILIARGISCLLMAPQPEPDIRISFNFEHFSAVTFGYTLAHPRLHRVTLHQFRSMEIAVQKLLSLGYQKPGLALAEDSDQRADRNWSAAFWSEQRRLPVQDRIPALLGKPLDRVVFMKWFRKYRPDVVLAIWPEVKDWLEEMGESLPKSVGLALLSIPNENGDYAGIWESPRLIGAKAIELLIGMIHSGERGVPETPSYMLVEGKWIHGRTLRSSE